MKYSKKSKSKHSKSIIKDVSKIYNTDGNITNTT